MRLLKLQLERYGIFTDKVVPFRQDACLHVVYGANEAGKTSALAAIKDLLFGFGSRTNYDFLHSGNKLSLGATIAGKDGHQFSFKRRKGARSTLTDALGAPLADDALTVFLGSLTRSIFSNSFGLSREALREGAEEMLKSGGDAGSSLFAAASGLRGLNELRKNLDTEAMAIFAPTKAQHRTFYQARERFENASRQIRALELKDRDLRERRAAIANFQDDLAKVRRRRADDIGRREHLVRQRDLAPLLRFIAADEAELLRWDRLPAMNSLHVEQLRKALDAFDTSQAKFVRLRVAENEERSRLESFTVESGLLVAAATVQKLLGETGDYASKRADVSRVQSEANGFEREVEELKLRLGLLQSTDLALVRPSDLHVSRLRAKIETGKTIADGLLGNEAAANKEEAVLEGLQRQLATGGPTADPKEQYAVLSRLKPAFAQLGEVQRLERNTSLERLQMLEKARQLSPAIADLDVFAQIPLPSTETIQSFVLSRDEQESALSISRTQVKAKTTVVSELHAWVDELTRGQIVTSSERIEEARSERGDAWQPLRSTLLRESSVPPLAETAPRLVAFERAVDDADRLSDNAIRDAAQLAEYASARRRVVEEEKNLEHLAGQVASLEREAEINELKWQRLWELFGFTAAAPRTMSAWLIQIRALLERRGLYQKESGELEQLGASIAAVRPALDELALDLGIPDAEKLPAVLALQAVQEELEQRRKQWQGSGELATLMKNAAERIGELQRSRSLLVAEQGTWLVEWSETLPLLQLAPATTPGEATAALEVWQQVPAALTQFEDRSRRVHAMRRDMESFEFRVAALLLQLQVDDLGLGADAMVKTLSERLTLARDIETKKEVARRRLREGAQDFIHSKEAAEAAGQHLKTLAAGLPDANTIADEVAELEAREHVLGRLRQRRETLATLSRGEAESSLREALTSFDEDAAIAEIEELRRKETQHNDTENTSYADLTAKEKELAALEAGVGAEFALQLRKNAEAELIACAQAWTRKQFGQILLAHAVEKHRSEQEQPLMKRASQLFAMLTAQSFISVEQEYDEKNNSKLVGRRDAERTVCISSMSEGVRDQLYLALRLAYLEEYASKTEPVPFIGDDLFTSFDEERTTHGLKALAATGNHIQPILFTHHKHVVEIASSELGSSVDIVELGITSGAG